jgi:6-phosphofructokinase 1
MDNDVRNTEYCIGFSTAITRAMDAIERQRTTVGSHERIGLFRVFGRNAGYTALYTAYVTSIRCAIPEYKFNLDKLIDILMRDKRENPSNYCLFGCRKARNGKVTVCANTARLMPMATARKPTLPRTSAT